MSKLADPKNISHFLNVKKYIFEKWNHHLASNWLNFYPCTRMVWTFADWSMILNSRSNVEMRCFFSPSDVKWRFEVIERLLFVDKIFLNKSTEVSFTTEKQKNIQMNASREQSKFVPANWPKKSKNRDKIGYHKKYNVSDKLRKGHKNTL